jgi:hypothetical protein
MITNERETEQLCCARKTGTNIERDGKWRPFNKSHFTTLSSRSFRTVNELDPESSWRRTTGKLFFRPVSNKITRILLRHERFSTVWSKYCSQYLRRREPSSSKLETCQCELNTWWSRMTLSQHRFWTFHWLWMRIFFTLCHSQGRPFGWAECELWLSKIYNFSWLADHSEITTLELTRFHNSLISFGKNFWKDLQFMDSENLLTLSIRPKFGLYLPMGSR